MATSSLQLACPGKCFVDINKLVNQPSARTDRREKKILEVSKRYCSVCDSKRSNVALWAC